MEKFELKNLKLRDLNENEANLISGGCDGQMFCFASAYANLAGGFSRGWSKAKAGWESFLAQQ
jgi:hypothetical protein